MTEDVREISKTVIVSFLAFLLVAGIYDAIVFGGLGNRATITNVVRDWASQSPWVEFCFVLVCVVSYLHFFRGWPCR